MHMLAGDMDGEVNVLGSKERPVLYMVVLHCAKEGWSKAQPSLDSNICCDSYSLRTGKSKPKADDVHRRRLLIMDMRPTPALCVKCCFISLNGHTPYKNTHTIRSIAADVLQLPNNETK